MRGEKGERGAVSLSRRMPDACRRSRLPADCARSVPAPDLPGLATVSRLPHDAAVSETAAGRQLAGGLLPSAAEGDADGIAVAAAGGLAVILTELTDLFAWTPHVQQ